MWVRLRTKSNTGETWWTLVREWVNVREDRADRPKWSADGYLGWVIPVKYFTNFYVASTGRSQQIFTICTLWELVTCHNSWGVSLSCCLFFLLEHNARIISKVCTTHRELELLALICVCQQVTRRSDPGSDIELPSAICRLTESGGHKPRRTSK